MHCFYINCRLAVDGPFGTATEVNITIEPIHPFILHKVSYRSRIGNEIKCSYIVGHLLVRGGCVCGGGNRSHSLCLHSETYLVILSFP